MAVKIKEEYINKIVEKTLEVGSMYGAINVLRESNEIDKNISYSVYEKHASLVNRIIEFKRENKAKRDAVLKKVLELTDEGYKYFEISKALNVSKSVVWGMVHRRKGEAISRRFKERKQAKSLIESWYKYSSPKSVLTNETIKAFELLNLTTPKRL
jgi:hypothetical protein